MFFFIVLAPGVKLVDDSNKDVGTDGAKYDYLLSTT